jgi:hypothetical protein
MGSHGKTIYSSIYARTITSLCPSAGHQRELLKRNISVCSGFDYWLLIGFSFISCGLITIRHVAYDFNAPLVLLLLYSFRIHSLQNCLTFEMLRAMLILMLMFMSDVSFTVMSHADCDCDCTFYVYPYHTIHIPEVDDVFVDNGRLGPLTYFTLELIQIDQLLTFCLCFFG